MAAPRLEARSVTKTFGSAKVLDDVELVVQPGEIHALIGQNGSGKSTLVKILTGYHAPDAGMTLALDGELLELPVQWRTAHAAGIAVVHQDLGLLDHLSVAENIGVGGYARSSVLRRIDWRAQHAVAQSVLGRLQVTVDPATPVGALPAAQRAEVAIARALRDHDHGGGLIILDEATRALPRKELARFHDLLRRVVADGTSVLMVSHNLDEVLAVSDRVTVLRDGKVAGGGLPTSQLTEQEIARLMLGRAVGALQARPLQVAPPPPVAVVDGLTADGFVDVGFTVGAGEVVGLTGLPGSGFEAIPYLVAGARRATAGTLRTSSGTLDLSRSSVTSCLRAGVALVPERRDRDGLAVDLSIRDNIALPSVARRGRPWRVARAWQHEEADAAVARLSIRTPSTGTVVKELSGGNQQKVLFAKWLSVQPKLLVLHEPTQAVDVGARQDLLRAVHDAAADGIGVLLVSIEPSDLVAACDRILVFRQGEPLAELRTTDPDAVLEAVYNASPVAAGGPA